MFSMHIQATLLSRITLIYSEMQRSWFHNQTKHAFKVIVFIISQYIILCINLLVRIKCLYTSIIDVADKSSLLDT